MKYHVVTLGCQMNISDSERLRSVMDEAGYDWTDSEEESDVLGVIACSVRQKAIDKVYSKIHKWNKAKNKRPLISFVTGCILPDDKDKFLKLFDLIFQMSELSSLPDMISKYGVVTKVRHNPSSSHKENKDYMDQFWNIVPKYHSDFEAFIPIQNGCDKFCTYCAVPYTRGREVSRPSAEILEELKSLVDQNYKSITLLGQNVNSYGLDRKGEEINFPQLLEEIGKYGIESGKDFWVYYTSPHPRDMSVEVIEAMAKYPHLANQVHLPIQSGDNQMLQRMNRKHDMETYGKIIEHIRLKLPQATIFTDIIVGFTGETDEEFENTKKAMQEFKYNMAYIAKYSPRPGAKSSQWVDDVDREVKSERLRILTDELLIHSFDYNKKLKDTHQKILVTGMDRKGKYLSGHTEGRIVTRILSNNTDLIGQFLTVNITGVSPLSIEGEIVVN